MANKAKFSRDVWERVLCEDRTPREVAEELGCQIQLVNEWAAKLGKTLKREKPGPRSKVDVSMIDPNLSMSENAALLGCSRQWLTTLLQRKEIDGNVSPGESSPPDE